MWLMNATTYSTEAADIHGVTVEQKIIDVPAAH